MASRTEELRNSGARSRGGSGGGAPFVKWGDDPAWVEGEVVGLWTTQYGQAVTLAVSEASPQLHVQGRDEHGTPLSGFAKDCEEVNVGLNHAALEGAITEADVGRRFHIAFEAFVVSKATKNKYRSFAVFELEGRSSQPEARGSADADEDSDLPF